MSITRIKVNVSIQFFLQSCYLNYFCDVGKFQIPLTVSWTLCFNGSPFIIEMENYMNNLGCISVIVVFSWNTTR